jgi:hypothetical protein
LIWEGESKSRRGRFHNVQLFIFLPVISIRMTNLMPIKRAKHMSDRQEKRNMCMDLVEISEEKNRLEDQGLDG